ncbi:hypothetical protein MTO96_029093, partial [Rhipicephalus appendiculatus]
MIWVLSTLIIVICLVVLSVSVVLLLALRTPGEGATTVPTANDRDTLAMEMPQTMTPQALPILTTTFRQPTKSTRSSPLFTTHEYHELNDHKYPNLYHHNFNKHKNPDLNEHKYPDLYHHNFNKHKYPDLNEHKYHHLNEKKYHDLYKTKYHYLCKHKYHNLNKYYNAVDNYFHRTANFSGTTNSNCSIRRTAASQSHYRSSKFYDEIYALWNQSIFHFGFLNVHREFSERDAFAETLVTLREIDAHIKRINVHSRASYMVLGASIQNRSMYGAIHLMSTIFIPSLFIAIGHISYSDAAFPDCRILPPTVWTFPRGVDRSTDFPYGHTYFESAVLLEEVRNVDPSVPLSLSLSLAGRYYKPRFTDTGSPTNKEFGLFKPCQDFNTTHYGDPVA